MRSNSTMAMLVTMAALAAVPDVAGAQSISPLVAEYRGTARGRVTLTNEGDRPLNVVLQVMGFRVDESGHVHDEPLSPDTRVELSASSVRIPPRQTRYVFYEAVSTRQPAWFAIVSRFGGFPREQVSGIDVQVELPHFAYILPSGSWRDEDIRIRSTQLDREGRTVTLEVENLGEQFGRSTEVEVRGGGERSRAPGFPLFPGGVRRVSLPWAGAEPPEHVVIRSKDRTIERTVIAR